jgi:membrane protease YdiL (CAAX protease family)|tara:strand:+ start:2167 stop:3045 length:879 start_codon:yes stop_codon:yes gene_type:complete
MHQIVDKGERAYAWRAFGLFVLLAFLLTSVFGVLMALQGGTPSLLVTGVMWSPGVSAMLCCLILKRKISTLPWRWGEWRWNWYAWLLPIAYGLVIYLPVWIFGLGDSGFGNIETLRDWTNQLTGAEEPNTMAAIIFLLMLATVGMVSAASRALGEEIGWRGFMIWEMRKIMPFWALGLLSGAIWAVWHWPAILFTDYNAGEGNFVLQMFIFTMTILPQGIVYAYFAFKSHSLWPAVILHASHNLFIQRIFTPLTIKGEDSHFYIDEFGIVMPIIGCLMAYYFYRRAVNEGIA